MAFIDLRSDTVTKPTREMRNAMMQADVGDDGRVTPDGIGEDPTVNRLEEMAAGMLGKERSLFMPSGTMGNLVALMIHCRRGDRVVVGENAHVYRTEKAAFMEDICGMIPVLIPEERGLLNLGMLEKALTTQPIRLVCVENTHNYIGGLAIPVEDLRKVKQLAGSHNVPVHMDGARIFNAATALDIAARDIADCADSVMFCLSKGLGAPIGSMLCGSKEFILRARERRKIIGGQMRQAGTIAAAGIEALNSMIGRLGEDHRKAKTMAKALFDAEGIKTTEDVHTNMFKLNVSNLGISAQAFHDELAGGGVGVHVFSPTEIRIVTHKDVSEDDCIRAADIICRVWKECRR